MVLSNLLLEKETVLIFRLITD